MRTGFGLQCKRKREFALSLYSFFRTFRKGGGECFRRVSPDGPVCLITVAGRISVLLLHNASDDLRGQLRRYMPEIKANVFVGTVSASILDILWKRVSDTHTGALLIRPDNTEQGFAVFTAGDYAHGVVNVNGVYLSAKDRTSRFLNALYAKPGKRLVDHMKEAGAVAEAIMRTGRAVPVMKVFADYLHTDPDSLIFSVAFLCAAHDIGKCHTDFVAKLAGCAGDPNFEADMRYICGVYDIVPAQANGFRHERYSAAILKRYWKEKGFTDVGETAALLAYHHQGKAGSLNDRIPDPGADFIEAQNVMLADLESSWPFDPVIFDAGRYRCGIYDYILGVILCADWICSGEGWMRDIAAKPGTQSVYDFAVRFLENGMMHYNPMGKRFAGKTWSDIFPFAPNALQASVARSGERRFDLCIIEYPCGFGKTEAAQFLALLAGHDRSGILMLCPTIATTKPMAERTRSAAMKLDPDIRIPEFDSSAFFSDNAEDRIDPELWPAKNRAHMLYETAVGTVDQGLKTVCMYRYSNIGLIGMGDKVVIVDEVHAYDTYMVTELIALIRYMRMMGAPVILLSATLPEKTKKKLLEAAGCIDPSCNRTYPLVTYCRDGETEEICFEEKGRSVPLQTVKVASADVQEYMFGRCLTLNEGCLCIYERTVDTASSLYKKVFAAAMSGEIEIDPENVILFHSENSTYNKKCILEELLDKFGKDRTHRPKKAIVIGTSILEQSMDVDFDYIVTALCPIDLLIQRIGRLWRHPDMGTVRERTPVDNPLTVVIPTPYDKIAFVYDEDVLHKTERVLDGASTIDTVDDVRRLIDTVYDAIPEDRYLSSRITAESVLREDPEEEIAFNTDPRGDAYLKLARRSVPTREVSYPTVRFAIVTEQQATDESFANAKYLYEHAVVPTGENKLKRLPDYREGAGYMSGVRMYITEDGIVHGDDASMELKREGIVWTKKANVC